MNPEEVRRSLHDRLEQLTRRVSQIQTDLRSPGSKDSEERAIEAENEEVLERLAEAERSEITEIRAALQRLDDGSYATCSSCGGEIAAKRLAALPYTRLCVDCAS